MKDLEEVKIKEIDDISKPEVFQKLMSSPDGMQKVCHVSDEMLQEYYTAAVEILEKKNWNDACDAFIFLIALNAEIYNFWIGLGIADQSRGEFEQAVIAYLMAELLAPERPEPYANIYQCLVALGGKEEAEPFLQDALDHCGNDPAYAELKQKLIQLSLS